MSAPNIVRCKSPECNAPIFWAVSVNGKKMPLDEDPVPDGQFVIEERGRDVLAHHIREKGLNLNPRADRYNSHYVTCPNAAAWRKP